MKQKKAALRQEMKARRATLQQKVGASAPRQIASRLLMLPEMAGAVQKGIKAERNESSIVAGFYPIQSEIDCLFLLKALNAVQWRCALPVMSGVSKHLAFKEWDLVEELKEGAYGTREPLSDMLYVMPDVVLVPLLAFDETGHRLGYGGGYYDRTLDIYREKGHPFIAIGVAFEGQKQDRLPVGAHDQPLDIIVTEEKVYRP